MTKAGYTSAPTTPGQAQYDSAFHDIFSKEFFEVEITPAILTRALARAKLFSDNGRVERTPGKKLADALMECAELPFSAIGAPLDAYDDAFAAGSVIYGVLEIKTVEFGMDHSRIRTGIYQKFDYMVVMERESTAMLGRLIDRNSPGFLNGYKLRFYPEAIFKSTRNGRTLVYAKPR